MDLSSMRHRDGGKSTRVQVDPADSRTVRIAPGDPVPPTNTSKETVNYQYSKDMWDVVVKDFHKRSQRGEIFNNPMLSKEETFTQNVGQRSGMISYHDRRTGKHTSDWIRRGPVGTSLASCVARRTLTTPNRVKDVAISAAYAGVSANTQNAVLWAGEAKETVKMVTDIGAGLLALYKRTAKQRKAWAKGKLTIPEAQSLTLALLYGILPLEQSIAQVTEGLFKLKPNGRQTSRGFQVYTDTNDKTWTSPVSTGTYTNGFFNSTYTLRESLQTTVRAGVLYDVDISDFPAIAIIADPKQITETAYALARLSFVIDWFINVGNTLMAWSPSTGTKVLAAWVSVTEVYEQEYKNDTKEPPWGSNSTSKGSGSINYTFDCKYTSKLVTRYPIDRSDLAIFPRVDINLNFSKLNSLVLLFADAKKKR